MKIRRRQHRARSLLAAAAVSAAPIVALTATQMSFAEDVSAATILQMFESTYANIEKRAPDIFIAGYGGLWTPPPGRAEQGNLSVGYDQQDRFDLGSAGNPTLYGTELGMKTEIQEMHKIGVNVYADLVWNHNGFADRSTPGWEASGGYPGFVLSTAGDADGDFHAANATGDFYGRTSNLIDIAHEKNHQFIRNPVPGFANNIPAGTVPFNGELSNVPTEANRRFYPDLQGPSTTINGVTYYKWNTANPSTGDPVSENATGYLMRNARWMVEVIGVDGFRLDATKHLIDQSNGNPDWVLEYYDQAVNGAITTPMLDGSQKRVFAFGEYLDANKALVQASIKKDANANRDALDFAMHYALKDNLSSNGQQNSWYNLVNVSQDVQDDGLANNGSQSVAFDASHDDGGAALGNVANAYLLMRPGNAIVYMNAKEFGTGRAFPKDGRGDALGGFYGDTITKLVNIRNAYGRGNYQERWIEKETLIFERQNSLVAGYSNRLDNGYDQRTVQTSFAPGTHLIELTGNATNATVDPNNDIFDAVTVNGSGQITIRVPRNLNVNGVQHDKGYVIYGPATPRGTLSFTNVARTIAGGTPTAATNGTTRLASIDIIKADSFDVNLQTDVFNLPDGFHDVHAEGDFAQLRFDGGLNINGNGGVDITSPGDVAYGFENFLTKSSPRYGGGDGQFKQTINATQLSEGYHYVTARAYRHRNGATGGDGGPAVFTDFRKVVYIDRFRPTAAIDSITLLGGGGGGANRDIFIKSLDKTATKMSLWVNNGAATTLNQLASQSDNGSNAATYWDRDLYKKFASNLQNGNNVFTIVAIEMSYDPAQQYNGGGVSVQRIVGYPITNGLGLGLGDTNADGQYTLADGNTLRNVLQSNNVNFNASADYNADGLVDEADNVLNVPWLTAKGADAATINNATNLRLTRANALDGTLSIPGGTLNIAWAATPTVPAVGLTFTDSFDINAAKTITKTGTQSLTINGPQNHGIGAALVTAAGTTNINSDGGTNLSVTSTGTGSVTNFGVTQHLNSLTLAAGGVANLTANGTVNQNGGKTLVTKSLSVTSAKLNLTNNNAVIDYSDGTPIGSWNGSAYTGVQGLLQSGIGDGSWNGSTGITSSSAAGVSVLHALAVAEASDVLGISGGQSADFMGQTVDATSVLIKYTYGGDANLDGTLNGDDYFQIDSNINAAGTVFGYINGDFNYDGDINGDDYFIIDSNINVGQSQPMGSAPAPIAALTTVPEPSAAGILSLAACGLAARRRRRDNLSR